MRIYTLHSVADNGLSLPVRSFRRFLKWAGSRHGFIDPTAPEARWDGRGALITFDDCFADNVANALPALAEHGAKAIFFFTPGFLGRVRWGSSAKGRWSDEPSADFSIPFGYMGLEELHALRRLGHEVGFHSRTHRNLPDLTVDERRDEIVTAKREWEQRLGFEFRYFAYPRGKYDESMFALAGEAGYRYALTTVPGEVDASTVRERPFGLPRFPVQRKGLFGWL